MKPKFNWQNIAAIIAVAYTVWKLFTGVEANHDEFIIEKVNMKTQIGANSVKVDQLQLDVINLKADLANARTDIKNLKEQVRHLTKK